MRFVSYLIFALAGSSAWAQESTEPAAATAPVAPAASSANTISIISPTGTKSYQPGENITVTWTNNGDKNDWDWWGMPVEFELADASMGINKVTPIGVTLAGNSTIGDLQLVSVVPASVPAGSAYCVRAGVKGPRGFTYFFSPTFPIGKSVGAPATGPEPKVSAVATVVAVATTAKSSAVAFFSGSFFSAAFVAIVV
ncbi:hypothetical protein BDR26DRAFT_858699 [Obelidium mucronatum]|nr:hypothetical protein BDR26DRAFT_858699 [Obelidium mucronatum]